MRQYVRLFTPGPVAVHPTVLQAACQQPLYHRHHTFTALMERLQQRLRMLFQTTSPVAVLTSSATGAHEAVAHMLHAGGGTAIVCINGRFSQRWASLLERVGIRVRRVESAWGENISLEQLRDALRAAPPAQSVWVVHSETSTGVLAPLEDIATLTRHIAPHAIICVDAVSSLGIHPLAMDKWDLDIVIASSQKGVGGLPGLALVAASQRARTAFTDTPATLYFDLRTAFDALERGTTPFTPAVTLISALDVAVGLIEKEGLTQRWARYARDATYLRRRLQKVGYQLFGDCSSNAVTVIHMPPHIPMLVERLEREYGFIVARGQEHYRDRLFRIGHCGWYRRRDLAELVHALEELYSSR